MEIDLTPEDSSSLARSYRRRPLEIRLTRIGLALKTLAILKTSGASNGSPNPARIKCVAFGKTARIFPAAARDMFPVVVSDSLVFL